MIKIATDYVVLGTGPAGSVCARDLAEGGKDVVVLDIASSPGGLKAQGPTAPPFVHVEAESYTPLFSDVLGGNSSMWKSKVYLPSTEEFSRGAWGFTWEDLKKASESASKTFGVDSGVLHSDSIPYYVPGAQLRSSIRAKIGNVFDFLSISSLENVRLLDDAHVKKVFHKDGRVSEIQALWNNSLVHIEMSAGLVVAAGGLGSPAFVLRHLAPEGFTSVGGLTDHPSWGINGIVSRRLDRILHRKFEQGSIDYSAHFRTIRADGLVQTVTPFPIWVGRPSSRTAERLAVRLASALVNRLIEISVLLATFGQYRFRGFSLFVSQERHNHNQMTLLATRASGPESVVVKWEITEEDLASASEVLINIKQELRGLNGALIPRKRLRPQRCQGFLAGYNPCSLTPISNEEVGINVDPNLRLNQFLNIWVVSSSVFPVSLVTNPTWTVICLARRLSQQLLENH